MIVVGKLGFNPVASISPLLERIVVFLLKIGEESCFVCEEVSAMDVDDLLHEGKGERIKVEKVKRLIIESW